MKRIVRFLLALYTVLSVIIICPAFAEEDSGLAAGDLVAFGHYEQDGNAENGPEEIEWIMLETDGKTAVLISRYGLAAKSWNNEEQEINWETCSLRRWLTGEFMNTAFSEDETAHIEKSVVTADANVLQEIFPIVDQGNDLHDFVYLLSTDEVNRLLPLEEDRLLAPTQSAEKNGAFSINGFGFWWTRTGGVAGSASYVNYEGYIDDYGTYVQTADFMVRPVIRLRLWDGMQKVAARDQLKEQANGAEAGLSDIGSKETIALSLPGVWKGICRGPNGPFDAIVTVDPEGNGTLSFLQGKTIVLSTACQFSLTSDRMTVSFRSQGLDRIAATYRIQDSKLYIEMNEYFSRGGKYTYKVECQKQ